MTQTSENVTWLTQEAYDQLKAELEHLSGPARAEITEKIAAAREEGDLKENAGYHAAKEEQGKQELRVRQLTQLLQTAKVGEAPAATGVVAPGMVVTIAFDGTRTTRCRSFWPPGSTRARTSRPTPPSRHWAPA